MPVWLLVIVSQSAPHPASCADYPAINAVENADTNAGRRICAFRSSRPFLTCPYRTPFPNDSSEPFAANFLTLCPSGMPMISSKNWRDSGVLQCAWHAHFARRRHAIRNSGRNQQPPCRPQQISVEITLPRAVPVTLSRLNNDSPYTGLMQVTLRKLSVDCIQ
jgi:hypothetical protein